MHRLYWHTGRASRVHLTDQGALNSTTHINESIGEVGRKDRLASTELLQCPKNVANPPGFLLPAVELPIYTVWITSTGTERHSMLLASFL